MRGVLVCQERPPLISVPRGSMLKNTLKKNCQDVAQECTRRDFLLSTERAGGAPAAEESGHRQRVLFDPQLGDVCHL